jgi:hypothetical protein
MNAIEFIVCFFLAAALLLSVAYGVSEARVALHRRARRRHLRRAARVPELAPETPTELRAISRERAAIITRDAEITALRAARGQEEHPHNPHPARSREFVLWEASFQSAMSDFSELAKELPKGKAAAAADLHRASAATPRQ